METPVTPPRELPIIGGHLALDFANTVDDPSGPRRHDHLATPDDVFAWGRRVGLAPPSRPGRGTSGEGRRGAGIEEAHRLRDVLNALFGSAADGDKDLAASWSTLRPFVTQAVDRARLVAEVPAHYDWSHLKDAGAVLHPVAYAAANLLVSDDLTRVKRCGRCPWLFVDRSPNRSRRWCDMDDCGRAQKIERYVARRAARRTQASQH